MTYTNVVQTPSVPVVASSFSVEADIIPSGEAVDPDVTLYYRVGTEGSYSSISMVQTNGANHYMTETDVPTSSHPGTPVYYYITTVFQGPAAESPAYYPAGGASDPVVVISRIGTAASSYTNLVVQGDINGGLNLIDDGEWVGIVSNSTLTDPGFTFKGTSSSNSVTWGDNSVSAGSLPLFGTSGSGESSITLSGTYTNAMIFYFNESNLMYSVNGCHFEDFGDFTPAAQPQSATNSNGWIIHSATVFNTNGAFSGNSCVLGGGNAGSQSYLQSPVFNDGIGNVSFRYRNQDETGTIPGALDIQTRVGGGDWQTVESVTNILTPDYIFHQFGYGNQQVGIEVRLVWNSADNPGDAQVAIDDFCVEEPGPYTLFTNLTYTPTNPTIADKVVVDVDVTPINYATNITASTWYRIGTNGSFTEVSMTNTGGFHFRTAPSIPRTAEGIIQYYVKSEFTTPLSNSVLYAYYPAAGPASPASYSNSDAFAASTYFEADEGWSSLQFYTDADAVEAVTNNGWIVDHCEIRKENYNAWAPGALWLLNTEDNDGDSYARTPYLTNGVGAIRFDTYGMGFSTCEVLIQKSYNGSSWSTVATFDSNNKDYWKTYTVPLQIEEGTYLRIYKNTTTPGGSSRLGIDNIEVTHPVAKAEIYNPAYDPLYPADSQDVKVSCDIHSVSGFSPAIDITARVYYKKSTDAAYTAAPIEMRRSGNHFVTVSGIPAQDAGTTIDYYIESTFKGYTNIISYSPVYAPSDAPATAYSYTVRRHASSYSNIVVRSGAGDIDMKPVADHNWLGIIHFNTATSDVSVSVVGQGFYDNGYLSGGDAVTWGDSTQTRTNLPYVGTLVNGSGPLVIHGQMSGQYLLTFNEDTGEYLLRRGTYQTFDEWPASAIYFEDSIGAANPQIFKQNFEDSSDWPLSSLGSMNESFESYYWNGLSIVNYPPASSDSFGDLDPTNTVTYVGRTASMLIPQVVGHAVMLNDNGSVQTHSGILNQGTGEFSFDVRCVNDAMDPLLKDFSSYDKIKVDAKLKARALPKNSSEDSFGHAYVSVLAHYQNSGNYYELRYVQLDKDKYNLELWKKKGGTLTRLEKHQENGSIDKYKTIGLKAYTVNSGEVYLQAYLGTAGKISKSDTTDPIVDGGSVGISGMDADIGVDSITVRDIVNKNDNSGTVVYSTECNNSDLADWGDDSAVWRAFGGNFLRDGYTDTPLDFSVEYKIDGESSWQVFKTYTGYTNTAYRHIAADINRPENMLVRIKQSNVSGDGHLVVDNLKAGYWHGSDFSVGNGWQANEAVVVNDMSKCLKLLKSQAHTNELQHIRSPFMTNGAAIIEFSYKSVDATKDLVFAIDYTVAGHQDQWQVGKVVTNSPVEWTAFSWRLPAGSGTNDYPMYMRVRNASSDFDAGMLIDDIRITEPIPLDDDAWRGYNDLITAGKTDKLLYEPGNVKGAYINNSCTEGTAGTNYDEAMPYIETAYLPDGIGEVSFWYRAWDTNASRIDIVASNNRNLPDSQWHLLRTINNITNQEYRQYQEDFYQPDYRFLRLRVPSTAKSLGRACVDNLMIAQPFGATVFLRNLKLIPEIPLYNSDVYLQVELYDTFLDPSNITVKAIFQTGTDDWGRYNDYIPLGMEIVKTEGNVTTYRTTKAFKAGGHPIDTVVQYYAEANFDGFFSNKSSPAKLKEFTNPSWYRPVDLNSNQLYKTPYYIVFSCLPGQVWINELNVTDDSWETVVTQYVEVCGSDRVNIGNWKLQVLNDDFTTNAQYTIGEGTTLTGNGGYGFFLLGGSNMPTAAITMTNALPDSGAVKLFRSMGAQEDAVSWDVGSQGSGYQMSQVDSDIVYAGVDQDLFAANPLSLYGTGGSNATDFVWADDKAFTPGATNDSQSLVPWGNETNAVYGGSLEIGPLGITNGVISFSVYAESNSVSLTPWYTTNLVTGPWTIGVNAGQELITDTTYRVWCDLYTNAPGAFYKVTSP